MDDKCTCSFNLSFSEINFPTRSFSSLTSFTSSLILENKQNEMKEMMNLSFFTTANGGILITIIAIIGNQSLKIRKLSKDEDLFLPVVRRNQTQLLNEYNCHSLTTTSKLISCI